MKMTIKELINLELSSLKSEIAARYLPELYTLRSVEQYSEWHRCDAFSHSIEVFEAVRSLCSQEFVNLLFDNMENTSRTSSLTSKECLLFASLIHDIGKVDTMQLLPDNSIKFPGHEERSAETASAILDRFGIDPQAKKRITEIIRWHDEPFDLCRKVLREPERDDELREEYIHKFRHVLPEVTILALCDLKASELFEHNVRKYWQYGGVIWQTLITIINRS